MSKRIYILGLLLLFVGAVSSCRFNDMEPGNQSSVRPADGRIAFELGTAKSVAPQTKGVAASQQGPKSLLCVEGGDSLYLSCSVVDNNDPVCVSAAPSVKGAPVTTENISEFYVTAYVDPTMRYFPITQVDDSDKTGNIYTLDYYWPQNSLDFFASNFEPNESGVEFGYDLDNDAPIPMGTFTYSLPTPDNENDAIGQKDYAFAIAPGVSEADINESNDGVVPLKFAHCFSAITFKIGSQFMDATGRRVKSIKITNVPSSGICTFRSDQNGDMVFDWNVDDAEPQTYIQQIPQINETETNVANGQVINDGEMTFMLIPNEISPDAQIIITFELHSDRDEHKHEMVVTKNIADLFAESAPKEWLAGKKYIYTLVSEENMDLEINDEFVSSDPKIIGNLEITNKGTGLIYIRAYILGWWENEDGVITKPWTDGDGQFAGTGWTDGVFNGSGKWKLGSDGFFYYEDVLWPGTTAEKLFDTYTLTNEDNVSRLVLTVVTQSVVHYRMDEVWTERPTFD